MKLALTIGVCAGVVLAALAAEDCDNTKHVGDCSHQHGITPGACKTTAVVLCPSLSESQCPGETAEHVEQDWHQEWQPDPTRNKKFSDGTTHQCYREHNNSSTDNINCWRVVSCKLNITVNPHTCIIDPDGGFGEWNKAQKKLTAECRNQP